MLMMFESTLYLESTLHPGRPGFIPQLQASARRRHVARQAQRVHIRPTVGLEGAVTRVDGALKPDLARRDAADGGALGSQRLELHGPTELQLEIGTAHGGNPRERERGGHANAAPHVAWP